MPDSRRPAWLIRFLYEVKNFCEVESKTNSEVFSWITTALEDTRFVKRNAEYKASECVRVEETEDRLTIFTLYKDNPMVEFTVTDADL